jgi:hypothetical protein
VDRIRADWAKSAYGTNVNMLHEVLARDDEGQGGAGNEAGNDDECNHVDAPMSEVGWRFVLEKEGVADDSNAAQFD